MSAAFGMDALFSRKGEATPAVQPAIPNIGRNRFEDLARALGHSVDPDGDGDAFDDEAIPATESTTARNSGRVTPFRRPANAQLEPSSRDDWDLDADTDETDAETDAADHAAPIGYGMIRRAKPTGVAASKPWQSVREALSRRQDPTAETAPPHATQAADCKRPPWVALAGSANGLRQTLTAAPGTGSDPDDIEIFLFGPEQAGEAGHTETDEVPPRRRHVSVRLPTREHELLRQFARLCGSTQQDVLRRSLLTYMIDELRQRLNATKPPGHSNRT